VPQGAPPAAPIAGTAASQVSLCVPRQSIACTCPSGRSGAQVCKADGSSFASCVCDEKVGNGGTSGFDGNAVTSTDAGTAGSVPLCTYGQSIACTCPSGHSGERACEADGRSFASCVCDAPAGNGGTSGFNGNAATSTDAGTAGPAQLCASGQSTGCTCPSGRSGARACEADGKSFASCVCDAPTSNGGMSGFNGNAVAGTTGPAPLCTSGQSIACTCSSGRLGAQVCEADGKSFSSCVCDAPMSNGGESGSGESSTNDDAEGPGWWCSQVGADCGCLFAAVEPNGATSQACGRTDYTCCIKDNDEQPLGARCNCISTLDSNQCDYQVAAEAAAGLHASRVSSCPP
jgi:hypothetical protein